MEYDVICLHCFVSLYAKQCFLHCRLFSGGESQMPNANVLEAKKAIVAELTEKLQNAASGVLVDRKSVV